MTDLILQVGASKLAISVVLAVGITGLTRRPGRPALAHGLWLLLLGALLVPPLVSIPLLPPEVGSSAPVVVAGFLEAQATPSASATLLGLLKEYGPSGLIWLWLLGSASVLGWTCVRALRFHRSLVGASGIASAHVQRMAARIACRLGLTSVPAVHATDAQVSPMVWWSGGRVRVLLPSALLSEMDAPELGCVLAHELAHVRRRDHLVRWLEWLACAAFWWNPVAWWARRKLRAAEELCCDALALAASDTSPQAFARSLLRAIDLVSASPRATAPVFASAAHGRERLHALEERFRMIVSDTPSPSIPTLAHRILRCGAVCVLAAGLVYCSDRETPVEPETAPGAFTTDRAVSAPDVTLSATDVDGDGDSDLVVGFSPFLDVRPRGASEPTFEDVLDGLVHDARLPGDAFRSVGPEVVRDIAAQLLPLGGQERYGRYAGVFGPDGEGSSPMVVTVDLQGLRGALGETIGLIATPDVLRDFVSVHSLEGMEMMVFEGSTIDCDGIGRVERYARLKGDRLRCTFWDGTITVDGEPLTPQAAARETPSGSRQ